MTGMCPTAVPRRFRATHGQPAIAPARGSKLLRYCAAAAALALLSACASLPENATACAEPRPLVCTMQFLPTCAVLQGGTRKEFSSPCTACADAKVQSYVTGSCPE